MNPPKIFLSVLISFFVYASGSGQSGQTDDMSILTNWQAGKSISQQSLRQFGLENCFTTTDIDDRTFRRIEGKSFKKECTTPRTDLRYLKVLHYNQDGQIQLGEMICNQAITSDLLAIFRALYDAKYPIERMVLIDDYDASDNRSMLANNSSAFNFRFIAGTTKLSNHSRGMAVDINPLYNPYVRVSNGQTQVDPAEAAPYVDRSQNFPFKIDNNDLACKLFKKHGFEWGGDWTTRKDYQHFEKY